MEHTRSTTLEPASRRLVLSQQQQGQWYAHLMTYFFCFTREQAWSREQQKLDLLQELGIALFGAWKEQHEEITLELSEEQTQALQEMLTRLQTVYARDGEQEVSLTAQEHVRQCLASLEQITEKTEIQSKQGRESREMKTKTRDKTPEKAATGAATLKRLPGYVSVREAAAMLGVSERSVYGYLEAGKLPGARVGPIIVVETAALQHYERRAPGRTRVHTPAWHIPPPKNLLYITSITVRMRQGQREQLKRLLVEMRLAGTHRIPGTVARYITGPHAETHEVELILVWRAVGMPSAEERQQALAELEADLAGVLDWQTALVREGRVLLHA